MKHKQIPPKERLLATAEELFHRNGYATTGINQILEEAGVAKASLYQHFKSKEELCIEYLNRRHHFWFDALHTFTKEAKSIHDKILLSFDFIMCMNEKENFRGCSFLNIVSEIPAKDHLVSAIIQNHKQDLQTFFIDMLPAEQSALAKHIYFLFESAIIESQVFKSQEPVWQIKNIVQTLLS